MLNFTCVKCGQDKPVAKDGGTGYGTTPKGQMVCYDCCADSDREYMRKDSRITLYLTIKDNKAVVANWPGTFSINCTHHKTGRHNMTGGRYDVWFVFDGFYWHGVQYGDNTQLCHCKQTKERAA